MTKRKSSKPKFDAAQAITDDLIRVIERGTLPWRKPWRGGGDATPLRHNGEAYQGVNNFLLSMKSAIRGFSSPYWMTYNQAREMDAQVRKGETSSIVIYYGTKERDGAESDDGERSVYRFLKSYRVFNANQIDGLDDQFNPVADDIDLGYPPCEPIPHMQAFFDAVGGNVSFTGRSAYYMPAVDKIYMPEISLFENPPEFYGTWAHEYAHWTKARHRLNRSYGDSRFGNTAYAREEIVAELTSHFLGQHLGFAAHTLEMSAAYLDSWLHVLKADKTAIFKHAADAQRAADYLIDASRKGSEQPAQIAA